MSNRGDVPDPNEQHEHISQVGLKNHLFAEFVIHVGGAAAISYGLLWLVANHAMPSWAKFVALLFGVFLGFRVVRAMLSPMRYSAWQYRQNNGLIGNLPTAPLFYVLSRGTLAGTLLYLAYVFFNEHGA